MIHLTLIVAKQHPKYNPSQKYGDETITNLVLGLSLGLGTYLLFSFLWIIALWSDPPRKWGAENMPFSFERFSSLRLGIIYAFVLNFTNVRIGCCINLGAQRVFFLLSSFFFLLLSSF